MKKLFTIFALLCAFNIYALPFTPNNIVVIRVGNGSATVSGTGYTVTLDEYTPLGVLVQSIPLPSGAISPRLVLSASATSEGALTLSPNNSYLVLAGYDAADGTSSVNSTGANADRVIGRISVNGTFDLSTKVPQGSLYANNNIRGAVTNDGTGFWTAGTGAAGNNGCHYIPLGGIIGTQLSTTVTNLRTVNIFNGQLYTSSSSGTFLGVSSIGTGLPTTTGQTTVGLPGFPTTGSHSAYAFAINPAGTIAYVADDGTLANGGGVQKWTFSAGTWSLAYTINTGITVGCRSLAVNFGAPNPVIYANTSSNAIVTTIDVGAASSFTAIVAAPPANCVFRGIAFTPGSILPVELSSFTSLLNGRDIKLNWTTNSETNNSGFDIERASFGANNSSWTKVGNVTGNGTTSISHSYSFTEKNLSTGSYNYRLKQVDNNGNYKYYDLSNEIVIGVPIKFEILQNYPNPFNPTTKIDYALPVDANVSIKIVDITGREVASVINEMQTAGYHSVSFNASSMSSGIYFYQINANGSNQNFVKTMKMLIVK